MRVYQLDSIQPVVFDFPHCAFVRHETLSGHILRRIDLQEHEVNAWVGKHLQFVRWIVLSNIQRGSSDSDQLHLIGNIQISLVSIG